MAVTLGANQYGKAETRVVRVFRDTEPHEIVDYNVSVQLRGDFADVHLHGDNTKCLTTDATKNTVNAFAKEMGDAVREPESFARALARHFVDDVPQVEPGPHPDRGLPVGPAEPQREPAPARLRPARLVRPHGHRHPTARHDLGRLRRARAGGAQDHRLGVPHLLLRPLHHARPTDDRIMASSVTAQWLHTDDRRRLGHLLRPRCSPR